MSRFALVRRIYGWSGNAPTRKDTQILTRVFNLAATTPQQKAMQLGNVASFFNFEIVTNASVENRLLALRKVLAQSVSRPAIALMVELADTLL